MFATKISSLFLFFLVAFEISSQNWEVFPVDRHVTYNVIGTDTLLTFVRVDSMSDDAGDTTYYFNYEVKEEAGLPSSCTHTTNSAGLFGHKMLVTGDTTYLYNKDNEPIKFITNSPNIPNIWKAYTYPDGAYLEIRIFDTISGTIFANVNDTVQRARFRYFNSSGNADQTHPWDDVRFATSGSHGFPRLFDWYNFPNDMQDYGISGMTNPDVGNVHPSAARIFDFDLGNEFHYDLSLIHI